MTAAAPAGPRWASVSSLPPPRLRAECSLTICGRRRRLRQRAERGQGAGGPTLLCLLPPPPASAQPPSERYSKRPNLYF